jgi:hypothetical protein
VGEIDDLHDTENEAKTSRDEKQDGSVEYGIQKLDNEYFQLSSPLIETPFSQKRTVFFIEYRDQ